MDRRIFVLGWSALAIAALLSNGEHAVAATVATPSAAGTAQLPPATLRGILWYGQSNAGNGGSAAATWVGARFPFDAVSFTLQQFGGSAVNPTAVTGTVPLQNIVSSPLASIIPMSIALEQFLLDAGRVPVSPRFWHTTSNGGHPISAFMQGTDTYNNLILSASKFESITNSFGAAKQVDAVVWVQGETVQSNYAAKLTTLIGNLVTDIKAATGQKTDPKIIIFQTNNNLAYTNFDQTPLDQYIVGTTVANAVLAGPTYYTPLEIVLRTPHIGVHGTEEGRMMVGEIAALVYKAIFVDGVAWNALVPRSINRVGNDITVQFALPPGGDSLAWDMTWIGATTHYGFCYTDDSASATISSVALGADGTSVRLTLSATPTGINKKILYAIGRGDQFVQEPWPAVRGQLISPTQQQSAFYRLGYAVPQYVNHYAARFQWILP